MRIPKPKVLKRRRRCENCGELLDAIWFTATMSEEWVWTGRGYNECSAHNSLVDDPHMPVRCPNCEAVVGTGLDFGFRHSPLSLIATRKKK
jgi:hypothetical protein